MGHKRYFHERAWQRLPDNREVVCGELYAGCADLAGERDPASVGTYRAAVLGDVCAERAAP